MAEKREQGLESDRVQVPALLLLCGAQNPFSSLKVRFMSVHPWFPPGHMAAVTLGDIRGLTELRKAEPQPSLTFLNRCQDSPHTPAPLMSLLCWGQVLRNDPLVQVRQGRPLQMSSPELRAGVYLGQREDSKGNSYPRVQSQPCPSQAG